MRRSCIICRSPLKRALGRGAYVVQTLRELARYRFAPIHLRLDGEETQAASVIVSKGRLYGGRFLLAPDALRGTSRDFPWCCSTMPAPAPRCCMARRCRSTCWAARRACGTCVRGGSISSATRAVPAQADGDAAGWTPISVTDAPASIAVVVG